VGDREILEIYLNSASKNTSSTDIFPYGTKSLFASVINEEDSVLIPKNRGEKFFSGYLHSEFFGLVGVSRYATTPLIVALSPGHNDISNFLPRSTIAAGNHLNCAEKIPKYAQTTGTVNVSDPPSGIL